MLKSLHDMIHPTAIIAAGASIGANVKIGPFCTVGAEVVLEDGVELVSHVAVEGAPALAPGQNCFRSARSGSSLRT